MKLYLGSILPLALCIAIDLSLNASAADIPVSVITLIAPNTSPDGIGGVCYSFPNQLDNTANTPGATLPNDHISKRTTPASIRHGFADGTDMQTIEFVNEELASPLGCIGNATYFALGPPGAQELMESTSVDQWHPLISLGNTATFGSTTVQVQTISAIMTAGNAVAVLAQSADGNYYVLRVASDGTLGLVAALGPGITTSTQACATATSYYLMTKRGEQIKVDQIDSWGVKQTYFVTGTTGDGQMACGVSNASLAWHNLATGQLITDNFISAPSAYNQPGTLQALAVDASGNNYAVIANSNGDQSGYMIANGKVTNLNIAAPHCDRGCTATAATATVSASTLYIAFPASSVSSSRP